jgi:prolipoprotein diacylglyceryltransferase
MKNGFLFSLALIILFSLRFVDEFFKINQEQFEDGMILNMGQILSIPFVLTGIVILILNTGKKTRLI